MYVSEHLVVGKEGGGGELYDVSKLTMSATFCIRHIYVCFMCMRIYFNLCMRINFNRMCNMQNTDLMLSEWVGKGVTMSN